jgi:protein ImuA
MNPPASARQTLVAALRREVARLEAVRPPEDERPISTGSPALDRLLPVGGLRRGTLVEYLISAAGSGGGTLALAAAREACREGRALVVLDGSIAGALREPSLLTGTPSVAATCFYPPAAAAWGIDLSTMLVLRPASETDALWALDQALRCPGVGAVWAVCDQLDVRDFRRLQLAAECGGTLGLLVRPARQRGRPTWADVQWQVSCRVREAQRNAPSRWPANRTVHSGRGGLMHPTWQLRVELVRCRGAAGGQAVVLELDEAAGTWREAFDYATHSLPVPAPLAHSTAARRA